MATDATGRLSTALLGAMPDDCLIEITLTPSAGVSAAGLLLRAGPDGNVGFQLRLEPGRQRLVLDHWPRPGDWPALHCERSLAIVPGHQVRLQVLISGSCLVAYACADGGGEVALSSRIHQHRAGELGLFASDGSASFTDLVIRTRSMEAQP